MYNIDELVIALNDLKSKEINFVGLNDLGSILRVAGISDAGWLTIESHDLYSAKAILDELK